MHPHTPRPSESLSLLCPIGTPVSLGLSAVSFGSRGRAFSLDSAPGCPCVAVTSASPHPSLGGDASGHTPTLTSPARFPLPGAVVDARLPPPPGGGRGPTLCKAMAQAPSAG